MGDTGPGLPQKARENLFQPFTGGIRKGGTGLGLAIAADLVRALAEECTGVPACAPQRVGVGAGAKDLFGWANVVRAVLLVPQGASAPTPGATSPAAPRVAVARDGVPGAVDVPATALTQVEANIDDLHGRYVASPNNPFGWVKPGEEANKIGYFRTFNGKLRYRAGGQPHTIDVRVIISWQNRWYITHLLPFKKH